MDLLRFSSRHVPERERAEAVQEAYASIAKVRVAPVGTVAFSVESSLLRLPNLVLAQTACTPCTVSRSHSHLSDGNDDLVLCVVTRGTLTVRSKGGEEILCHPGDVYLGPNDLPVERIFHERASFVDLAIPRSAVGSSLTDKDAGRVQAKVGSTHSPELRLLAGYVRMLAREKRPISPEMASLAAVHVHDLVVTALGATRDAAVQAGRRGVRAARIRAIKADVVAHASRGDLTLEEVAARHAISPQYVRSLFHAEGTTFTDFVRNERLKRAYRRLNDPRFTDWTITRIAFDSGFNDLSYFNRAFRRRYGMTPSEARERILVHVQTG